MARHVPLGHLGIGGQAVAPFNILGFAVLAYLGYRQRQNSPEHKRLMMLATISLLPAAFSRWPVFHDGTHLKAAACCFTLVALIACYGAICTERQLRSRRSSCNLMKNRDYNSQSPESGDE